VDIPTVPVEKVVSMIHLRLEVRNGRMELWAVKTTEVKILG
jgi:hypothetical protein